MTDMKAIMVMFDSLNRHFLSPYGCDWVQTPNFDRLASHTAVFDNFYAGSLPCMPARRELHTGRYNFLHRSWGPIELYDDSMPELLKNAGIYTHLCTDHWHYWEEGGADYQTKYNTFEYVRGQEGDPWKGRIGGEWEPEHLGGRTDACGRQEYINRAYMREEEQQSIAKNFRHGLEFIDQNHDCDNWFLQLENFDPHEPFFVPEKYMEIYETYYHGRQFDWPQYVEAGLMGETEEETKHCICKYAALVTMCDEYLGQVLDRMDQYDLWKDTMLIVNTDHGFLLTEHDWWGKVMMPYYNELVHLPFFIWDPRCAVSGVRRQALAQTIDIAPTLLGFFGQPLPEDMLGKDLREAVDSDQKVHEYVLFGMHGAHVNITDGRYVYMRAPVSYEDNIVYNYMLAPTSYPHAITPKRLETATLCREFSFTKGAPLLKVEGGGTIPSLGFPPRDLFKGGNLLFDLARDPAQEKPLTDEETEKRFCNAMVELMAENEAPSEQYDRLGLKPMYEEVRNCKITAGTEKG